MPHWWKVSRPEGGPRGLTRHIYSNNHSVTRKYRIYVRRGVAVFLIMRIYIRVDIITIMYNNDNNKYTFEWDWTLKTRLYLYYFHLAVLASDFRRCCADIIETAVCCTTNERPFRHNIDYTKRVYVYGPTVFVEKKTIQKDNGWEPKNKEKINI